MMTKLISLLIIHVGYVVSAEEWEKIFNQGPLALFSGAAEAWSSNEDDPSATLYSILGTFNDNDAKQAEYRDAEGKFEFKLIYENKDGTTDTLIWRQTSWLDQYVIEGADLSNIPAQTEIETRQFNGLGASSRDNDRTIIDGDGSMHSSWWNSVGSWYNWDNNRMPAFNGKTANQATLYIKGIHNKIYIYNILYNICL